MEKQTVRVPEGWHEVTIGQFQEIVQMEKQHDIVSVLLDEDPEIIRRMDPQSAEKIAKALAWVKTLPNEDHYKRFIEVPDEDENGEVIIKDKGIQSTEYRLVENLNGFTNGEWLDMEEYLKDFHHNLHLILAMLYRPAGEYRAEDVNKRAELFRNRMMIGDVYGCFVFFSHVTSKSMITIPACLSREILTRMKQNRKKEKGSQKKERLKSGRGTRSFTLLRAAT